MRKYPFQKKAGGRFMAGSVVLFLALDPANHLKAQSLAGASLPVANTETPKKPAQSGTKTPLSRAPTTPIKTMKPDSQADSALSIDDLLNVTVTSAGQKEQKLSDVAAAITVLDSDDIRRSGATNIPDLLRYVPGVEVGQANNSDVSVTVRGFGGVFATKLLVLVDGRSIYDPIFGGVDWQYERMMMEDIDRVEVIRGPGATIWGANAVNGVINIITKDAADTQGGLVSTVYGTKEDGMGTFRYGFAPIQGLSLRLYGQYENEAASESLPGDSRFDQFHNGLIGFRADYRPDSDDHFRLSSDGSLTHAGDELFDLAPATPYAQTGDEENVNFVYEHNFDVDNQVTVQSYFDRFRRNTDPADQFSDQLVKTYDVQIRHTLPIHLLPIKQELTYGVEYREVGSQLNDTRIITWLRNRNDQTASLFAQTDLHLIDNVLTWTMGAKYDHNDFTGSEVQPSARLLWKINGRNSVWASVSRAVREPQVLDYNATQPGTLIGNPSLKSEVLIAYELGYRVQPADWLSLDIATFYNDYTNLIQGYFTPGSFFPTEEQFKKAQVYGIEPSFTAQLQSWWKLTGSYSLLKFHANNSDIPQGYIDPDPTLNTTDPANEFSLRSSFDLPDNIDLDLGGRYVDKVTGANGYFALDARLGWRPTPNWELSIVGQNLLAGDHIESPNQFGNTTYISPEVYGKVAFKF